MSTPDLLELIHLACAEAMHRGTECLSAAQRELVTTMAAAREGARLREEEARRIAATTAEQVRRQAEQRQRDEAHRKERDAWARRKGIAQAFHPIFGNGCSIQVWRKDDKSHEKRVYVNGPGRTELACCFITGNHRKAPGTLDVSSQFRAQHGEVLALCRAVARDWNAIRVDFDAALAWEGEAIALVVETSAGTALAKPSA